LGLLLELLGKKNSLSDRINILYEGNCASVHWRACPRTGSMQREAEVRVEKKKREEGRGDRREEERK
jgi:hypothetical protein